MKRTKVQADKLYEAFIASKLSVSEYADKHRIPRATLQGIVMRRRDSSNAKTKLDPSIKSLMQQAIVRAGKGKDEILYAYLVLTLATLEGKV